MSRLAFVTALLPLAMLSYSRGGELPTTTPVEVGLSSEQLDELKPGLQKLVDGGKIPGAVALIARHGKIAYVTSVGYRDLVGKTPMTVDTIFAIASMTKPVTCVAAMILVEQGKLGLDDPVEKYLPELKDLRVLGDPKQDTEKELATVPSNRPIKVRELFSHTSGFAYGFKILGDTSQSRLQAVYSREGVSGRGSRTIADQVHRL